MSIKVFTIAILFTLLISSYGCGLENLRSTAKPGITALIIGSKEIYENSSGAYSVVVSNAVNPAFQWICSAPDLGTFTQPTASSTEFRVREIQTEVHEVTVSVSVQGEDGNSTTVAMAVNIRKEQNCGLTVSEISGPANLEKGGSEAYSVSATNDTGISYKWTCVPGSTGSFTTPFQESTQFAPSVSLSQSTKVTLQVEVKSDHCSAKVKSKVVDIAVPQQECDLAVGDIEGVFSLRESTCRGYSITAYAGRGVTYNWSCYPASAGSFLNPTEHISSFCANQVINDAPVTVMVDVNGDDCDPVIKEKEIQIKAQ